MAEISKAKEVVKEKLLGTDQTEELKLSAQCKAAFEKHAHKDAETGELFMTQEDFIDAIAPVGEDYVSLVSVACAIYFTGAFLILEPFTDKLFSICSIRSSVNSMPFSSASPTDRAQARSVFPTGACSRTCSRSQTPNMRLPSAFSI